MNPKPIVSKFRNAETHTSLQTEDGHMTVLSVLRKVSADSQPLIRAEIRAKEPYETGSLQDLAGERQIGREDRRKIDYDVRRAAGSEPCLRNCDEPGGNSALDVAEQFSTFVCGHSSNSSWLKRSAKPGRTSWTRNRNPSIPLERELAAARWLRF
jgi:hypothetical protein